MKTIVLVGGGSLGHIIPNIAFIKEIKKQYKYVNIVYFATYKDQKFNVLTNCKMINRIYYFDSVGINRKNLTHNNRIIQKTLNTLKSINNIYKSIHPALIIGSGGYLSGLAIYQASKLLIPSLIYEQNAIMGLANKLSCKYATKITAAFKIKYKKYPIKHIGSPHILQLSNKYNDTFKKQGKQNILFVAGSLGATKICETALEFVKMPESKKYYTTIITGYKNYDHYIKQVNTEKHFCIVPFINDLPEAINKNDLIITRAGATTIFELIALEKKAIFIPSPNVSNNHQFKNAQKICEHVSNIIIEEKDLTVTKLINSVYTILNNSLVNQEISLLKEEYIKNNFLEVVNDIIR